MKLCRLIAIVILSLFLLSVLGACFQEKEESDVWTGYFKGHGVFSDEGYYYADSNFCLCFLDVDNGINVCLCAKVGCQHNDSSCDAYLTTSLYMGAPMFFWNDGIYYFDSDGYGEHLYRRNADGTGKQQIATIGQKYFVEIHSPHIESYICAGNYLYYCIVVRGIVDKEVKEIANIVFRLDLRTGREEELFSAPAHEYITLCAATPDRVVFLRYIMPEDRNAEDYVEQMETAPVRLMQWSADTQENTVLMEKPYQERLTYKTVFHNKLLYTVREAGRSVTRSYDLNSGHDEKVSDQTVIKYITDRYALIQSPDDDGNKRLYDLQTGTVLPSDFNDYSLNVWNVSEKGMIICRSVPSLADVHMIEKSIFSYVSFDALADGLQEEDVIDFWVRHFSV